MARDGRGADNVRRRARDAGVYLRIGRIGADEARCRVQANVVNLHIGVVLWGAIVVDLTEDTGRGIDGAQSIRERRAVRRCRINW